MAYGQPFYNYGATPYNAQNNGYMGQQPQYGNFYGQQQNVAQNANNGVTQQYQQQIQQQAPQMTQVPQVPPRTNIAPVASLVDAMSRLSEPNTNMYYADQDKPFIYQISIDMQGRKTYKTFKIEDVTEQVSTQASHPTADVDLSGYAKKEDLEALKKEFMSMANALMTQQSIQPTQTSVRAKNTDSKPKTDKE